MDFSGIDRHSTLHSREERERRRSLLREPHVAPLTAFVERLRQAHPDKSVPWFDPEDAGVGACILLLLESPARRGAWQSQFVSADNPSNTAKKLWQYLRDSGVDRRREIVFWNIVPWYIGNDRRNRTPTARDITKARSALIELLTLLSDLRVVVLMGKKAQDGWKRLYPNPPPGLHVRCAPHPSARRKSVREIIQPELEEARRLAASPILT